MGKRKRDSEPRKDGRPKRTLVRWDQDLDIQLLLSIQAACNANQVKIPWDKVASLMGEKFTDGSIIQHLSKMRIRREAEGKPCPPPLRRSIAPATKKLPSKGKNTRGGDEDDDDDDELFVGSHYRQYKNDPDWLAPRKAAKGRSRKRKALGSKGNRPSSKADDEHGLDENSDSSLSDLSDDERLCVGFPFLELPGKKGHGSDEDRLTEPSESPGDAQPRGQESGAKYTGDKKIVRFSVPSSALQALEETGVVGPGSNPDQIIMPIERPSIVSYNTAPFGMGHPVMTSPRPAPTDMTYPPPQNIAATRAYPAQVDWNTLGSSMGPAYGYGYGQQSQQRMDDNMTGCINPALLTRNDNDLGENENHAWPSSQTLPPMYPLPYSPRGSRGAGPGWTS